MANKYANLIGTNLIKDEYTKINTGFDKVEADINAVNTRIDTIITTPIEGSAQEIVEARVSDVKEKTFATLDDRFEETEQDIATHMAESVSQGNPHGIIYEEGIWTPALRSPNITYTEQYGKYIRHNNLLWLLGSITVDEITEENTNLVETITGFPFVHSTDSRDRAIVNLTRNTLISYESGYNKISIVGNSSTNMFFDDTTNVKTRTQIRIRNLIAGGSLSFWVVYKIGG